MLIAASQSATRPVIPAGKIVLIGDSLVSQGEYIGDYSGYAVNMQMGGMPFYRANYRSGCPFTEIINAGIGSEQSPATLARFSADVLAQSPGWVMIWIGTNDFSAMTSPTLAAATTAQMRTKAAEIFANITSMIVTARNAGIRVIVGTVIPRVVPAGQQNFANGAAFLNRSIREYCRQNTEVILFDGVPPMMNLSTLVNAKLYLPLTANYWTTDISAPNFTHNNMIGGWKMGDILYAALLPYFSYPEISAENTWGTTGDMDNAVNNGLFIGTTGTVTAPATGSAATGWTIDQYGTVVATCAATKTTHWTHSNIPAQKITLSGVAVDAGSTLLTTATYQLYQSAKEQLVDHDMVIGDEIFAEVEVNVTETVGSCRSTILVMSFYDAADAFLLDAYANYPSGQIAAEELAGGVVTRGRLRTNTMAIPPTATKIVLTCLMTVAVGATTSWEWSRAQICKAQ